MTVVIVGAGPAGLILAYLLDGNVPFYDPGPYGPHPDRQLHRLLSATPNLLAATNDEEILQYVKANFQSFFTNECLPANLLLDTLLIPNEANLQNLASMESRVSSKYVPQVAREYMLISDSGAGGQWRNSVVDDDAGRVLSYAEMLSLPQRPFSKFYEKYYGEPPDDYYRPTRGEVAKYYADYATQQGIHVLQGQVNLITRVGGDAEDEVGGGNGAANGRKQTNGDATARFTVRTLDGRKIDASDIVLASGINAIPSDTTRDVFLGNNGVIVVVGTGVSAADAVINAGSEQVVHIFKWEDPQGAPCPLRRYPRKLYPEYKAVFDKMRARRAPNYLGLPNAKILQVSGNGELRIECQDGKLVTFQARELRIRTGRTGLVGYAHDIIPFQPAGPVEKTIFRRPDISLPRIAPHVWAAGSLTGDALVRHLLGMCCALVGQLVPQAMSL